MRDRSEERCLPEQVNLTFVSNRVDTAVHKGYEVDTVFMSPDIYRAFIVSISPHYNTTPAEGVHVCRVCCASATVDIKMISGHIEFLFAGTQKSLEEETWFKVDQVFEEEVLS